MARMAFPIKRAKFFLKKAVNVADYFWVNQLLKVKPEKKQLLTFLFHGVFQDRAEVASGVLDPQQELQIQDYKKFFNYYLNLGYEFIAPTQIFELEPHKKYILMSFDDGYYNNLRILPLLEEYQVPCTFFISTGHIDQNKSFWWDSLYRGRFAQGKSKEEIYHEGSQLKQKTTHEIDSYLLENFGPQIFKPVGDLDRPFTASELSDFAKNKWVYIGNHTVDHSILTACDITEAKRQIQGAQSALEKMIGVSPKWFAYPNGDYNLAVEELVKSLGFEMVLTCDPHGNRVPITSERAISLGRFCFSPEIALESQLLGCRTDKSILRLAQRLKSYITK